MYCRCSNKLVIGKAQQGGEFERERLATAAKTVDYVDAIVFSKRLHGGLLWPPCQQPSQGHDSPTVFSPPRLPGFTCTFASFGRSSARPRIPR